MPRRTKASSVKELWRKSNQRNLRIGKLRDLRLTTLKTLDRRDDTFPALAPERLIVVDVRKQALHFRQHQLIRTRIIIDALACKQPCERRSGVVVWTGLIGALDRDADAHAVVAGVFGKVASFRGGDQQISIGQRALTSEHSPNGQSAVGVEVIISDELYAVG